MNAHHVPVLADAVSRLAAGSSRVVDGTVGGGGHAARLRALGAVVFAVDRDPEAIASARDRLGERGCIWRVGRIADPAVLADIARFAPELVLLDLGISTLQLDTDRRGFSFRPTVPLDMRLSGAGVTAAELLNTRPAAELATIFREYGDEPRARRLAQTIVDRRARRAFATSDDLVNAIRGALGPRSGPGHFARLFQALRIAVNDELTELESALDPLRASLVAGGRLAVITYHSGEDRIVKRTFRDWERTCVCPPRQPLCTCRGRPLGRRDPRRPIVPSALEVVHNRRARSARLRAFRVADGS